MTQVPAPPEQHHVVYAPRTSGLAIASLVCGLAGFFYLIPAVLGIVFGFVARKQIRTSPVPLGGAGMALAGILCGSGWIALVVVIAASVSLQ